MQALEIPLLKYELKTRLRLNNLIKAIFGRYLCLGFIFLLVELSQIGKGFFAFIVAQTISIMLFIPANIYDSFASESAKRDLQELAMTRLNPFKIISARLFSANIYNFIVIMISFIFFLLMSFFYEKLNLLNIVYSNIVILLFTFVIISISLFFCSIFLKNILMSTILSYFVILLLLGSVIISGPFITRLQSQQAKNVITNISLYANPTIALSRVFGNIDIMRTTYLYTIADPIVGRGFTYPNWRICCIIYFIISILLMTASFSIRLLRR
jgi:ABC-type transport system involved in multi-copper enzyme maturation permease subunit